MKDFISRFGWVIPLIGAAIGVTASWFVARLFAGGFFGGVLGLIVCPVAAWLGLLLGLLIARWLADH